MTPNTNALKCHVTVKVLIGANYQITLCGENALYFQIQSHGKSTNSNVHLVTMKLINYCICRKDDLFFMFQSSSDNGQKQLKETYINL